SRLLTHLTFETDERAQHQGRQQRDDLDRRRRREEILEQLHRPYVLLPTPEGPAGGSGARRRTRRTGSHGSHGQHRGPASRTVGNSIAPAAGPPFLAAARRGNPCPDRLVQGDPAAADEGRPAGLPGSKLASSS